VENRAGTNDGGVRLKNGIKGRYLKSSTTNCNEQPNETHKKEGVNILVQCDFMLKLQHAGSEDKRTQNEE
jgi:hypothetical protein